MKKVVLFAIFALVLLCRASFAYEVKDVPRDHWAYSAIEKAMEAGVLQGYNNRFHGKKTLNRFQMAVVVARILDHCKTGGTTAPGALKDLEALVTEFADELALINVKVSKYDQEIAALKAKKHLCKGGSAKKSKIKLGGRIMFDTSFYSEDNTLFNNFGSQRDGFEFRRARFFVKGKVAKNVQFKANYDWAGGDTDFKDVFIQFDNMFGDWTWKVGHFKEPYSLEELTSSKYITFIERSLPIQAFSPGRSPGFVWAKTEADSFFSFGLFKELTGGGPGDAGNSTNSSSNYNTTLRFAKALRYEEKGKKLLHLGVSYTQKNRGSNMLGTVRYRARPETHLNSYLANTNAMLWSDGATHVALELAHTRGPTSFQAEFHQAEVQRACGLIEPDFDGMYVYVSHFLTGEHRPYKGGKFGRVKPKKNYGEGGKGAVEVALRVSNVDLNQVGAGIAGGDLSDITFGINWYLNPKTRIMLNYITAEVETAAGVSMGEEDIVAMRYQVDF